jgi:hypothetical protein
MFRHTSPTTPSATAAVPAAAVAATNFCNQRHSSPTPPSIRHLHPSAAPAITNKKFPTNILNEASTLESIDRYLLLNIEIGTGTEREREGGREGEKDRHTMRGSGL